MSCDQVETFETLTVEVLRFVQTNHQNNVLVIFKKYKMKLFSKSSEQISPESEMEVDEIEVEPENKVKMKRMEFHKSLMLSLRSNSEEIPTIPIMASYNSFKDLLEAMTAVKKELDNNCVGIIRKSIVGKLLWISKRFNRFKEALSHCGNSKSWANFLIHLYKHYLRHPNISKSSPSLHALRSNINFLNDIVECLPEFDDFN